MIKLWSNLKQTYYVIICTVWQDYLIYCTFGNFHLQFNCTDYTNILIQTFYPSTLSVLCNNEVYPTSFIVWSTPFSFSILKSHYTKYNTIISFIFSKLFYFTDIKMYIYLCTLLCVYILLLLSCFGCSQYILVLSIIPSSFHANHTI